MAEEKKPRKTPRRKKTVLTSKQERMAELAAEMDKKYGEGTLRLASQVPDTFSLRRPIGIPSLDVLLKGGWPAGGVVQVIGEDGVGKTDISWRTLAKAQENYGDNFAGALVTVEKLDKSHGRFAGVHIEYTHEEVMELIQEGAEIDQEMYDELTRVGNLYTPYPNGTDGSAEEVLNLVLDLYASRQFQVIVLDSIAALAPRAVLDKSVSEEARVASLATKLTVFMQKLWNEGMRLIEGEPNETTLILLNQFRENVNLSNPKADQLRIMGGRALKHGKLVDLYLIKGGTMYTETEVDVVGRKGKRKVPIGKKVTAKIIKGKAGLHEGGMCEWQYRHTVGVDVAHNLISLMKYYAGDHQEELAELGFQVRGANYYFGEERIQGQPNAIAAVRSRPELVEGLMNAIYKIEKVPPFRVV